MNGDMTCGYCNTPMKEYDLCRDGKVTGDTEVVCPNQWKAGHP